MICRFCRTPFYVEKLRGESGGRKRERQNSNSKTLIPKDSSVRSSWTYLTASPCRERQRDRDRDRERERENRN